MLFRTPKVFSIKLFLLDFKKLSNIFSNLFISFKGEAKAYSIISGVSEHPNILIRIYKANSDILVYP